MREGAKIAYRWLAEEAAVFAIKLAGTFASDRERCGGI
jgi:hypothetical protein